MKKILDTSIIAKWFFHEDQSEIALKILDEFKLGKIDIIIPSLLFYELGNLLINKGAKVKLSGEIIEMLNNLGLQVEDIGKDSFRKIYQNSLEYDITFYDSSFLTLMQKHKGHFVTADQKLYSKIKDNSSNVTLLK